MSICSPSLAHDVVDPSRVTTSPATLPSTYGSGDVPVAVVAEGLAAASVPWVLAPGTSPAERRYELVLATDVYDAWLIYWPPGTGLEPHDHGGSAGAFAVVSGTLDEDTIVDGISTTTRVRPGDSLSFSGSHVHAVVNRDDVAVTSVHVYSPPLRAMGFYREFADGQLMLDRVDDVELPADDVG